MLEEFIILVGLFALFVGSLAIGGWLIEDVFKVDAKLARWVERRLR